mgnify:CR=1 FL=1
MQFPKTLLKKQENLVQLQKTWKKKDLKKNKILMR